MPGSGTGDPYIRPLDGPVFQLDGDPSATYLALADADLAVTFGVRLVGEAAPGKTYIDRAEVRVDGHVASFTPDSARLDGAEIPFNHRAEAGGLVASHTRGAGGELRVDLHSGPWWIAILHDPGLDPILHEGGPLERVPHLALFIHEHPDPTTLRGLFLAGLLEKGIESFLA